MNEIKFENRTSVNIRIDSPFFSVYAELMLWSELVYQDVPAHIVDCLVYSQCSYNMMAQK